MAKKIGALLLALLVYCAPVSAQSLIGADHTFWWERVDPYSGILGYEQRVCYGDFTATGSFDMDVYPGPFRTMAGRLHRDLGSRPRRNTQSTVY